MKKITQQRFFENDTRTLGRWTGDFICDCLELPGGGNEHNKNRIPAGEYLVKKFFSEHHQEMRYKLEDVPDRSGIEIDIANYPHELLGCVAIGKGFDDIDDDGQMELTHSKVTWESFMEVMNGEDFMLTILDIPNS